MDNIIEIIFVIIGVIISATFFIAGIYFLIRAKKEKKYSCQTYGKIIDNTIRREVKVQYNTKRYYYALCEYIVGETKCIRETNIGTTQPKYEVGQIVTVFYNPDNYHEAYIEGDNNSKATAIVCFVLGLITSIFIFLFFNYFL